MICWKYFFYNFSPNSFLLQLLGDKLFVYPLHRAIMNRVKYSTAPTYVYRFSFSSYTFGTKKFFVSKKVPGACHADDISYVFKTVVSNVPKRSSQEWKTIERMCECLTSFARTGNPNNDVIAPVKWEPVNLSYTSDAEPIYKCIDINDDVSFMEMPELERLHFWDRLHQDLKCQEINMNWNWHRRTFAIENQSCFKQLHVFISI